MYCMSKFVAYKKVTIWNSIMYFLDVTEWNTVLRKERGVTKKEKIKMTEVKTSRRIVSYGCLK